MKPRKIIHKPPQDFVKLIDEMELCRGSGKVINTKEEILDDDQLTNEITRMRAACNSNNFAGFYKGAYALAHHQVSKEHFNLFVLATPVARQFFEKETIIVNPRIIKYYGDLTEIREGCMSHPYRQERKVRRFSTVDVEYDTMYLQHITRTLVGIPARIFQHEFDHCQGITIWRDKTYSKS
jgi:peptide deformylase